eukprot:CAMPEP_0181118400 /NCGR_PEP_ID=MMETSP1071-20121207/23054_1 /TAXON_ID=35127 /ORGANISM="Thalassiosira sp., Strain NH16" /LENGTH=59 /DNA_ID=CAMNT_0023202889 /DNA_START=59 /DNA_END=238 /DNA_ORIENTATION=+
MAERRERIPPVALKFLSPIIYGIDWVALFNPQLIHGARASASFMWPPQPQNNHMGVNLT